MLPVLLSDAATNVKQLSNFLKIIFRLAAKNCCVTTSAWRPQIATEMQSSQKIIGFTPEQTFEKIQMGFHFKSQQLVDNLFSGQIDFIIQLLLRLKRTQCKQDCAIDFYGFFLYNG